MTNKHLMSVVAASLAITGCAHAAPAPQPMQLVGGWGTTEVTPEIEKAAQFALGAMNVPADSLDTISDASQQVVAGMNYRMVLTLKDGRRFDVQVFHALDDHYELTSAKAK